VDPKEREELERLILFDWPRTQNSRVHALNIYLGNVGIGSSEPASLDRALTYGGVVSYLCSALGQPDAMPEIYQRALDWHVPRLLDKSSELDTEFGLRVGDWCKYLGRLDDATAIYERIADDELAAGRSARAIAILKLALRHTAPHRADLRLKLAVLYGLLAITDLAIGALGNSEPDVPGQGDEDPGKEVRRGAAGIDGHPDPEHSELPEPDPGEIQLIAEILERLPRSLSHWDRKLAKRDDAERRTTVGIREFPGSDPSDIPSADMDPTTAIAELREALRHSHIRPDLHLALGFFLRNTGDFEEARKSFRDAEELCRASEALEIANGAQSLAEMMDSLVRARSDPGTATSGHLRELLMHSPDNPVLHTGLGFLLQRAGRLDEALESLIAAERLLRRGGHDETADQLRKRCDEIETEIESRSGDDPDSCESTVNEGKSG
jgi:tetratricopeptide (TPR) repeat protein